MIKYHKPKKHEFSDIIFFKGIKQSQDTEYLYDESLLYLSDDLSVHLFEYEDDDLLDLDLQKNKLISDVSKSVFSSKYEKNNVFEIEINDIDTSYDVIVEYHEFFVTEVDITNILKNAFGSTDFKLKINKIDDLNYFNVKNIDPENILFFKINLSIRLFDNKTKNVNNSVEDLTYDERDDASKVFYLIQTDIHCSKMVDLSDVIIKRHGYEFIIPKPTENTKNIRTIASISGEKIYSDFLFNDAFGLSVLRPNVFHDPNILKKMNNAQSSFKEYVTEIRNIISRSKLKEVCFVDFRISKDISTDIQINYEGFISESYMQTNMVNFRFSKYTYEVNTGKDLDLISAVSDISNGIHAFQVIISDKLFDPNNHKCAGVRLYEETMIYSDLTISGKISGTVY